LKTETQLGRQLGEAQKDLFTLFLPSFVAATASNFGFLNSTHTFFCVIFKQAYHKYSFAIIKSESDLSLNQAIQNQRNSFSRGFPLPFNVETLQAFGALFQIPQYYRKFLYCKTKMFM
jgi:hypothetical protein